VREGIMWFAHQMKWRLHLAQSPTQPSSLLASNGPSLHGIGQSRKCTADTHNTQCRDMLAALISCIIMDHA
jgi:hypothetical protein